MASSSTSAPEETRLGQGKLQGRGTHPTPPHGSTGHTKNELRPVKTHTSLLYKQSFTACIRQEVVLR